LHLTWHSKTNDLHHSNAKSDDALDISTVNLRTGTGGRPLSAECADPIRVFERDGRWVVDYGSYVGGYHATRAAAVVHAEVAARTEGRELVVVEASASL
jgi:hypothetical protein